MSDSKYSHEDGERLFDYIADHGADHDDDCPGDDTCSCSFKPISDSISRACMFLSTAPSQLAAMTARAEAAEAALLVEQRQADAIRAKLVDKEGIDAALVHHGPDAELAKHLLGFELFVVAKEIAESETVDEAMLAKLRIVVNKAVGNYMPKAAQLNARAEAAEADARVLAVMFNELRDDIVRRGGSVTYTDASGALERWSTP